MVPFTLGPVPYRRSGLSSVDLVAAKAEKVRGLRPLIGPLALTGSVTSDTFNPCDSYDARKDQPTDQPMFRRRRHRRIAKQWLSQKALDELTHALNREALEMVNCLLVAGPSGSKLVNAKQFIGRYSINNTLKIVFGIGTDSIHDPLPRRYINVSLSFAQSTCLPDPNQRDHWAFGAGRRICPGIAVADRAMWLAIFRMLWAFNMEAAPEHPINLKGYDGLAGKAPVPFQVYLKPRHENVAELLEKASRESGNPCEALQALQ
ncbi:hypothetical protein NUW58_g457 [Xylaria curta]|uniref:Uncharacterized protein n=1 Tax=Xylaria curta TaxID=42375 RepID=A0ACC1PR64_9PEZI|nr:hypothetical protein NUW58_g457 [Xylaria curta]